jgi:DNA-binding NarL/FixJ family response regulator
MAIRVVFAEDSYLIRNAVTNLLESNGEIELVATCEDLDSLIETIEAEEPDVVLTDIRMPPDGTDEGIRAADTSRRSGEANTPKFDRCASPQHCTVSPDRGVDPRSWAMIIAAPR